MSPGKSLANARLAQPKAGLRVLVVEDDAIIGELVAEMLEEMGHEVCGIAATEAAAVAAAARYNPDLMIVDAWLQEGSGLDAVATILLTRFVLHLFISGDISRVTSVRPDAFALQKPFRQFEFDAAVRRVIDNGATAATRHRRRHPVPGAIAEFRPAPAGRK